MHPSHTRVADALRASGVDAEVRTLPESTHTAAAAAEALGCPIGAIANSLVFVADDRPILVMSSGAGKVDTELLADLIGVEKVRRASADEVRGATGFPIGGVAPVGHARTRSVTSPGASLNQPPNHRCGYYLRCQGNELNDLWPRRHQIINHGRIRRSHIASLVNTSPDRKSVV